MATKQSQGLVRLDLRLVFGLVATIGGLGLLIAGLADPGSMPETAEVRPMASRPPLTVIRALDGVEMSSLREVVPGNGSRVLVGWGISPDALATADVAATATHSPDTIHIGTGEGAPDRGRAKQDRHLAEATLLARTRPFAGEQHASFELKAAIDPAR